MVSLIRRAEIVDLREQLLVLQVAQLDAVVMMLPNLVDVLVDGLEALLLGLSWLVDLVDQVREHLVSPLVEQLLQQLVLVVEVLHFDYQRIDLLNFVHHVEMLLCFDGIQNPFALLGELGQFQERCGAAGLSPRHHKVDDLGLGVGVAATGWYAGAGDETLWANLEQLLVAQDTEGLAVHDEESRGDLHGDLIALLRRTGVVLPVLRPLVLADLVAVHDLLAQGRVSRSHVTVLERRADALREVAERLRLSQVVELRVQRNLKVALARRALSHA
jgi:hypothetical protein